MTDGTRAAATAAANERLMLLERILSRVLERSVNVPLRGKKDKEGSGKATGGGLLHAAEAAPGMPPQLALAVDSLLSQLGPRVKSNAIEELQAILKENGVEEQMTSLASRCFEMGVPFDESSANALKENNGGALATIAGKGVNPVEVLRTERAHLKREELGMLKEMLEEAEGEREGNLRTLAEKREEMRKTVAEVQSLNTIEITQTAGREWAELSVPTLPPVRI